MPDQIGRQVAHAVANEIGLDHGVGPAADIDRGKAERLVHRHKGMRRAHDPGAVAERLLQRLAQADRDIFDGMMLVDLRSPCSHLEVEQPVLRHLVEHMVEKADAGADLRRPLPSSSSLSRIAVSLVLRSIVAFLIVRYSSPAP